jgi:preprotein translocase subunit Sec63
MTKEEDLYEILGVSRDADRTEIKRAYYQLAKEHHPDKVGKSKEAERKFAKIAKAYDVRGGEPDFAPKHLWVSSVLCFHYVVWCRY